MHSATAAECNLICARSKIGSTRLCGVRVIRLVIGSCERQEEKRHCLPGSLWKESLQGVIVERCCDHAAPHCSAVLIV